MFNNTISKFVQNKNFNEFEIRFNERKKQGVSLDTFNRIINTLKSDGKNFVSHRKEISISTIFNAKKPTTSPKELRMTEYKNSKPSIIIEKKTIDIRKISSYNMKLSLSNEVPININPGELNLYYKGNLVRNKERQSFSTKSGNWKIDLTMVRTYPNHYMTFEVELESTSKKVEHEEGNKLSVMLLQLIQDSDRLITNEEAKTYAKSYAALLKLNFPMFAGPMPKTISSVNYDKGILSCGYSVTDKADGVRYLLYCNDANDIILIPREKNVADGLILLGKSYQIPKNSVLDGEKVGNVYYIFDALVVENIDVRNNDLLERLTSIKNVLKKSSNSPKRASINMGKNNLTMKMKKFYIKDIYKNATKIFSKKEKDMFPYNLDGLIFTPLLEGYDNSNIFKWKKYPTIDFQIEKIKSNKAGKEKWNLRIAALDSNNEYRHFNSNGSNGKSGFKHYIKKGILQTTKLDIPSKNMTIYIDKTEGAKYFDKSIVEFKYYKNKFEPILIRYDKEFANNIISVNESWDLMKNTIPVSSMYKTGPKVFCGRKYHNKIKENLISKYMTGKKVLDIGSGAGGNIGKYQKYNIKNVRGVDIVDVEYAHPATMKFYKVKNNYNLLNVLKNNSLKSFDVINCQFAIHYFFKSQKTLSNLITNVNNTLKKNGLFVITCMDGNEVKTKMKDNTYKTNVVEMKLGETNSNSLVGNQIEIKLEGTKYFKNKSSKEYLVNVTKFIRHMKTNGFNLENKTTFDQFRNIYLKSYELMSQQEKEFSKLHVALVFKKIS